jgi:hypothetical protein
MGVVVTLVQLPGSPKAGADCSDQLIVDFGHESTTFDPLRAIDNSGVTAGKT